MRSTLSVLLIDENPNDALLIASELRREAASAEVFAVTEAGSYATHSGRAQLSVVVLANDLTWIDEAELLRDVRRRWTTSPVVRFYGANGATRAGEFLQRGWIDFAIPCASAMPDLVAMIWVAASVSSPSTASSRPGFAMEGSPLGYFRCFANGRLFDANRSLARMFHCSDGVALLVTPRSLWPPEQAPQLPAATSCLHPCRLELSPLRDDGQRWVCQVHLWPLTTPSGATVAYEGWAEDLTRIHCVHTTLHHMTESYRALFDHLPDALTVVNSQGVLVEVNSAFERLSGYRRCELVGRMECFAFVAASDAERMRKYHRLRLTGESPPASYEYNFVGRDGEVRRIQLTVCFLPAQHRSLAIHVDRTDRLHRERGLQYLAGGLALTGPPLFAALAENLALGLEVSAALIAVVDPRRPDCLCLLAHSVAGRNEPATTLALADSICAELIHGPRLLIHRTQHVQADYPNDPWLHQAQAESFLGLVMIDRDGRRLGVVAVASRRSIRSIRFSKTIMQLVTTRVIAELANRSSGEPGPSPASPPSSAALASPQAPASDPPPLAPAVRSDLHDLNNLLTAILGFSSLLQFELERNSPAHLRLEAIVQAGDRAAAITGRLLGHDRR